MNVNIQPAVQLDDRLREGLAGVLDWLLPGTQALPSGRAVQAHEHLLDLVLGADPTLVGCVTEVAERAAGVDTCSLDNLTQWVGEDIDRVVFALHAAYYMSSDVRAALGYPGQGRRPVAQATPDEVASDELVAPVLARGAIYVPTPD